MTLLVASRHFIVSDNLGLNGNLPVVISKIIEMENHVFSIVGCVSTGEAMIMEFLSDYPALTDPEDTNTYVIVLDKKTRDIGQLTSCYGEKCKRAMIPFLTGNPSMMGDGWRYLQQAIDLYNHDVVTLEKAAEIFQHLWLKDTRSEIVQHLEFEKVTKYGEMTTMTTADLIDFLSDRP